ncbi:MAG: FAD-dependent thymidylate synthase [Roseiarcus sp.]|jgi:thymidylate synthase (FAD)
MDALLGKVIPVLDHGFIRLIDYMGNDDAIVQAARVSYGRGTKAASDDRALIRYLMRNRHTSPFEMAEIKLHVRLPIFVARQWIRHRTASVNEYSARYSVLEREFYVPEVEAVGAQSTANRQGRRGDFDPAEAQLVADIFKSDAERAYGRYLELLNQDAEGNVLSATRTGVARELARIDLPLSFYTQWYWKIDLHNLLSFLSLRAHPNAQLEIRAYAQEILKIVAVWVPHTYEAFVDYRRDSYELSRGALEAVRRMLRGERVVASDVGLSPREWRELGERLGVDDSGARSV